jgi:Fe-S cluster assembly protein SufB
VDPELLRTYEKLGIPLKEQMILAGVEGAEALPTAGQAPGRKVAVDAVFDSVSLGTTFKAELARAGVIFCSISEAVREHPELVRKYLGSVVSISDNFYATLNAAVFSDGSFVYIPPGCAARWSSPPTSASMPRTPASSSARSSSRTRQLCELLEGCTAPKRDGPAPRRGGRDHLGGGRRG